MSAPLNFEPTPLVNDDTTSLAPGNYYKTQVLNNIYKLIANMIGVLQAVTAAQANRLTFLTNWQQAYTDSLNQIRSFAKNDGTDIDSTTTDDMNTRDDLNRVNSNYTERLRGSRDLVSNDAKALQTNVNQGNDAINNQTDLATSILQELSQILSTIYR